MSDEDITRAVGTLPGVRPPLRCYQCDQECHYLFADGRCWRCTRVTAEEVRGEDTEGDGPDE